MLTQIFYSNWELSIVPWWVLLSFIASLSLWLANEKVRNHWRGVDKLYSLYLLYHANGQMHMYWFILSIKINTKCIFCRVLIQVSQDGFMLRFICMLLALGCDLLIQLLLKLLSSLYDKRLVDHFHLALIRELQNMWHLMLEQVDLYIFVSVIYQYSCFFV